MSTEATTTAAPETGLIKAEEITPIANRSVEVLGKNSGILGVYRNAGKKLLARVEAEKKDGKLPQALDDAMNKWQVSAKIAIKTMNEERSPITQTLDKIKKAFTTVENELSALYEEIQAPRDASALIIQQEETKARLEEQRKLDSNKERIELAAKFEEAVRNGYAADLAADKAYLIGKFNAITLENYATAAAEITNFAGTVYTIARWDKLDLAITPQFMTAEELTNMKVNSKAGKFDSTAEHYKKSMEQLKAHLISGLEHRKSELEAIAAAGLEEKERLQREMDDRIAAEKKEAEDKVAAEAKVESDRIAAEKEAALGNAEIEHEINILSSASTAPTTGPTLDGCEIEVLNKLGWKEIVNFWFINAAPTEELSKFDKKTLTQMKAYAEKAALKGVKITSENLKYNDKVKAVASSKRAQAA